MILPEAGVTPIERWLVYLAGVLAADAVFGKYSTYGMPLPEGNVKAQQIYLSMEQIDLVNGAVVGNLELRLSPNWVCTITYTLSVSMEHALAVRAARLRMAILISQAADSFMEAEAQAGRRVTLKLSRENALVDDILLFSSLPGDCEWDQVITP